MIIDIISEFEYSAIRSFGGSVMQTYLKWLRNITIDTKCGLHRIDHGLVAAEIFEFGIKCGSDFDNVWKSPGQNVEIHAVIEGRQTFEVGFLGAEDILVGDQILEKTISSIDKNIITIRSGQMCVLFPNEIYRTHPSPAKPEFSRIGILKIPKQRFSSTC